MGSSLTANSARRNRVSKSGGFGYNQRVIDGTLTQLHLGDLLQWLRMGELSGRLTLIGNGYERRLDFFAGRLVYLSSLVPEERLGTVMVSEGLLPASVARQHLARSLVRRQPYTSILVEEGGIPVDVVISGLSRLARLILARVLAASEGSFSFDPGYPVQELPAAKIDIEALSLLEAASSDDQVKTLTRQPEEHTIPFTGDAFANFFWEVVREGITTEDPVDGPQMAGLYNTIRDIMGALALCLGSSPGLIPMSPGNATALVEQLATSDDVCLSNLPHAVWNQMVLARCVRSSEQPPLSLADLEAARTEADLWLELSDAWSRPHAARLDELTGNVVDLWARAAAAAAGHLDIDPEMARLAVHLVTIPTELVQWFLTTLDVAHIGVRSALLKRLPRRVAVGLAYQTDFPEPFRELFEARTVNRLGVSLYVARQVLTSANLWLRTVPEDDFLLIESISPAALTRAANSAVEAAEDPTADPDCGIMDL